MIFLNGTEVSVADVMDGSSSSKGIAISMYSVWDTLVLQLTISMAKKKIDKSKKDAGNDGNESIAEKPVEETTKKSTKIEIVDYTDTTENKVLDESAVDGPKEGVAEIEPPKQSEESAEQPDEEAAKELQDEPQDPEADTTDEEPEVIPDGDEQVTEDGGLIPNVALEETLNTDAYTEETEEHAEEKEPEIDLTDKDKTIEEVIEESSMSPEAIPTDKELNDAVDDIVREESDTVLETEDEQKIVDTSEEQKRSLKDKLAVPFVWWWQHSVVRNGTLVLLLIGLVMTMLVPGPRYFLLNTVGVRVESSLTVIDAETRLPLEDIKVTMQNQEVRTDESGNATFADLRLGSTQLVISKVGYADTVKDITLGWGSNPVGEHELLATGEQFMFVLSDWLSGDRITNAEARSGENIAKANDQGEITLTVGAESVASFEIMLEAEGYRTETFTPNDFEQDIAKEVSLVHGRPHTFVSNRNGQFDIYSIYPDGSQETLLLAATGDESEAPRLLPHPSRSVSALVSSRAGEKNSDGFTLDEVFIIDGVDGSLQRITRSEQIQMVGWVGDNLVFQQVVEGTSRGNPERSKLFSYDLNSNEIIELAAANYFNDVALFNDQVYYAVSAFAVPQSRAKLFRISVDGSERSTFVDEQVYTIFRDSFEQLIFNAADQQWFETTNGNQATEIDQPGSTNDEIYIRNPDGSQVAWVDVRDGKGVLLTRGVDGGEEQQIVSQPGLETVLYWLDNKTLVYQVVASDETAVYVVAIDQQEAKKIVDVTAVSISRGYF